METAATNRLVAVEQPYLTDLPPATDTILARVLNLEHYFLSFIPTQVRAFFLLLDLFPFYPKPKVGGVLGVRSINGVFSSLVLVVIFVWFVYYTLLIFLQRNPNTNFVTAPYNVAANFPVNFAVGMTINSNAYWDPRYIALNVYQVTQTSAGKTKVFPSLKACTLGSNAVNGSFCPYVTDSNGNSVLWTPSIQGTYGAPVFKYIVVEYNFGSLCTLDAIDAANLTSLAYPRSLASCIYLPGFYDAWANIRANVFVPEIRVFTPTIVDRVYMQYVSPYFTTSGNVYVSRFNVSDSSNIMFTPYQGIPLTAQYCGIESFDQRESVYNPLNAGRIFKFNIVVGTLDNSISRTYATYLDLFSHWGGFMSLLAIIFSSYVGIYNRAKFRYYYSWDLEPFMKNPATQYQHRAIMTRYIPVDSKGIPVVDAYKVYKTPD